MVPFSLKNTPQENKAPPKKNFRMDVKAVELALDENPNLGGNGEILVLSIFPLSSDDTQVIQGVAADCNPPVSLCFWAKMPTKASRARKKDENKEQREERLEKLKTDFQEAFEFLGPFKKVLFLSSSCPGFFDNELKSWLPAAFQENESRLIALQTPEVKELSSEDSSDFNERKESRRREFRAFFLKEFDRSYIEPEEVESPDQTFRRQLAEHHATLAAARPPKTVVAKASASKRKANDPVPASQPLLKKFFASKS